MSFKKHKIIYVNDVEEMNEHLRICRDFREKIEEDVFHMTKGKRKFHSCYYYTLKIFLTKIELSYTPLNGRFTKFVFQLDGKIDNYHKTGMECFSLLQRMSNSFINDMTNDKELYDEISMKWKLPSIAGAIWVNPELKNIRIKNCISYDKCSAYSWAMLKDMPNTNKPYKKWACINENEIGFNRDIKGYCEHEYLYLEDKPGTFCEFVFEKIESPFKKFVEFYYNKKSNAKNKYERQKYKDILNFSVGYIRRKNPFIHSAILSYSNYDMYKKVDYKTTYATNTDSIVSIIKRNDLEIGEEIGQFKIEKQGEYVYSDSGYQWDREIPSIRGKSKEWFKNAYPNGFDILKDTLPYIEANYYELNEEMQLIKKEVF